MVLGMSKGLGTLPWLHSAINQAASLYGVVLVLVCVKGWATRSPLLPCNRATVYNNAHSADNRNSPMRAGEDGEHMGRKQQPGFINTGQVVLDGLPYLEAAGLNLDSVRRVSKGFKSIERDANMHASVPKASIVACKCIGKMLVPESLSLWCSSSKAARWLCFTIKQITGSRPSASSHPACIACTGTDDLESTRTVSINVLTASSGAWRRHQHWSGTCPPGQFRHASAVRSTVQGGAPGEKVFRDNV
eukprot:scaffold1989_cov20-Tisochrysis_lutea.AAC.1